jgi:hypothetical protein
MPIAVLGEDAFVRVMLVFRQFCNQKKSVNKIVPSSVDLNSRKARKVVTTISFGKSVEVANCKQIEEGMRAAPRGFGYKPFGPSASMRAPSYARSIVGKSRASTAYVVG